MNTKINLALNILNYRICLNLRINKLIYVAEEPTKLLKPKAPKAHKKKLPRLHHKPPRF